MGLDVHAETITAAIVEADGEVRSLGTIRNREDSIRKLIRKPGPVEQLCACYESGSDRLRAVLPAGAVGCAVQVVAQSLVPKRPGTV